MEANWLEKSSLCLSELLFLVWYRIKLGVNQENKLMEIIHAVSRISRYQWKQGKGF